MGTNYYHKRNIYSDEELVSCYLKHESQNKAADELGVSRETVARAVRRAGLPFTGRKQNGKNQPQQKISDSELIEEAKSKNIIEIAIKYDISEERLWRRAKRLGITIDTHCIGGHCEKRAYRYGCIEFDNTITLKDLIIRDKGICKICGMPTDETDIKNGHIGRMYPTLDHIIPLSKGGTHTWNNVQLAHMYCNAGKCDRNGDTGKRGEAWT